MSEICSIPSPYKLGAQKPPFWTTLQLKGSFNGLYLPTKHDIDNRSSALTDSHELLMKWLRRVTGLSTAVLVIDREAAIMRAIEAVFQQNKVVYRWNPIVGDSRVSMHTHPQTVNSRWSVH